MHRFWKKYHIAILITIFILAWFCGYLFKQYYRKHLLEVYIFNLSKGNAMLIRTPDDERILVNGGGNTEIIRSITKILPFYSRNIDTIVATDCTDDNIIGLMEVINRYSVGKVVLPEVDADILGMASTTCGAYDIFKRAIIEKKIDLLMVKASSTFSIGKNADKSLLKVLFPVDSREFKYSKASYPQMTFLLEYGPSKVLFMGNISTKIQKYIASTAIGDDKDIDLLIMTMNTTAIDKSFASVFKPKKIIYSKAVNNRQIAKSDKVDPFYFLLEGDRINTKTRDIVRLYYDDGIFR